MVKRCPSCGYNNFDGAVFCSGCSASLGGLVMPMTAASPQPPMKLQMPPMPPMGAPFPGPAFGPPPMLAPAFGPPPMGIQAYGPPPFPPAFIQSSVPRALWGFILSMIAGILVILNAAALLSNAFYSFWVPIFFWIPTIDSSPNHGLIFAFGIIIGLILVVGSILMLLGYGTIGSIVVFPLAVLSLILGGGFVAGFVLGVLGGILGMLGR